MEPRDKGTRLQKLAIKFANVVTLGTLRLAGNATKYIAEKAARRAGKHGIANAVGSVGNVSESTKRHAKTEILGLVFNPPIVSGTLVTKTSKSPTDASFSGSNMADPNSPLNSLRRNWAVLTEKELIALLSGGVYGRYRNQTYRDAKGKDFKLTPRKESAPKK